MNRRKFLGLLLGVPAVALAAKILPLRVKETPEKFCVAAQSRKDELDAFSSVLEKNRSLLYKDLREQQAAEIFNNAFTIDYSGGGPKYGRFG